MGDSDPRVARAGNPGLFDKTPLGFADRGFTWPISTRFDQAFARGELTSVSLIPSFNLELFDKTPLGFADRYFTWPISTRFDQAFAFDSLLPLRLVPSFDMEDVSFEDVGVSSLESDRIGGLGDGPFGPDHLVSVAEETSTIG